jgi:DNA polymerase-3 subunit delta
VAKQAVPFVVIYGGEDYFLDCELDFYRTWPNRHVAVLDGSSLSGEKIVAICEEHSFDESDRIIVVDDAHKVKACKALEEYVESKSANDSSVILVAICRADKLPAVWSASAKKGKSVEHAKLKTWDNNNEVIAWISDEAKALGASIDSETATNMYRRIGSDLRKLSNELRKLVVFVGKGNKITFEHVNSVCVVSPTSNAYQVVESASDKNVFGSLVNFSFLCGSVGEDAAIVPVTMALQKHLEKLVIARQALDKGTPEEDIAVRLGMHPWRFKNFFLPMVRKNSLKGLLGIMETACRLEIDVKGAGRSKRTLVELALHEFASTGSSSAC